MKLRDALKSSQMVVRRYYRKTSYAQCGEDLIVRYIFDMLGIRRPSYIDIGAYHPYSNNNTCIFYKTGSRGINIEADQELLQNFRRFRKRDINLNVGIGDAPGEMTFHVMSYKGLNTFSASDAAEAVRQGYRIERTMRIRVRTVSDVLAEYWGGTFPDLLTIDIEGMELAVLQALDFKRAHPKVICVETSSFSSCGPGEKRGDAVRALEAQGYFVYADTYLNTILVSGDCWRQLKMRPI